MLSSNISDIADVALSLPCELASEFYLKQVFNFWLKCLRQQLV
jgi:hypothetical protein